MSVGYNHPLGGLCPVGYVRSWIVRVTVTGTMQRQRRDKELTRESIFIFIHREW